ncbi:DMT family transporter [Clostridiaceae bacterium HSG29]|nr:DMT family transporter [Clostridiaceae bacterium HSG29]
MIENSKKNISDISLFFVAVVWGGGFVIIKDTLSTVTPMLLIALRFIIASVLMYMILHKKIGKISKNDIKKGGIVGIVLYLAFATQTYGLQFTTASKQGFLTAVYVAIVPFLYWILYKKRPDIKVFVGSFLTIIGIGLISLHGSLEINIGDSLTLICALFFAMHIISIEYFAKDMDVYKLAFIQIAVAAVFSTVSALLTEPFTLELTNRAWYSIIFLAVFSTFGCFTVQTIAQKYTSSSHASILMSLESVFAAIFGIILLNEVMTPLMIFGSGLIFIAILIIELDIKEVYKKKSKTTIDKKYVN